jgi:ABC-type glycerol-3-phosphate transport system permease component
MLFCNDQNLQTLQLFLRRLVVTDSGIDSIRASYAELPGARSSLYNESIKMACCVVATFPILVVYPFLQKHFAKGVMIGAIKG